MTKKNPHAVALGKMGGSKGGKRRAAKLTPEERSASAKKAALARWAKKEQGDGIVVTVLPNR
jgi:hypothetical protein